MSKPVVIVESPTKVRTLKKYIGKKYKITATAGHIKDLPPKEMGIDLENDFKAKYLNIKGKQKVIKELKAVAGDSTEIYLAPDPDREGEAIAFHTAEILKKKGRTFHRVLFHELTKNGVNDALNNPLDLDRDRYDAQQARRILDRLVGYQISPLLWRKVQGGLSAGRVQSVAVRIICEREKKIQVFEPVEYWSVTSDLEAMTPPVFNAKLAKKDGKKIEIPNKESVDKILSDLSDESFKIESIKKKTTKRNPQPPFITSKLQQEAINRLKFTARKTMSVAQQLYEGVDLGPGEPEGLITYMRTDSIRVADEAAIEAIDYVKETLGSDYTIEKPRQFANKNKVQDAHEAIRPTSVHNTPEKIASYLSPDQLSLYTLIWRRFVASQMSQALIDQNTISIDAGIYTFTVSGSTVKFAGFMSLYMNEEDTKEKDKKKQALPELKEGMDLKSLKIIPKQHFTMPPPRFSEASLVKELEEKGIGRPSTYATILSTIREKGYVDFMNRYFRPSELGFIVTDLLVENFPDVLDVAFTAKMEENLDKVETGDTSFIDLLSNFYSPFEKELETAKEDMVSIKGVGVETDIKCPQCEKEKLHVKVGKNGPFLACNGYPDCNYSRNYDRNEKGVIVPIEPSFEAAEGKFCDNCGSPMMIKQGRFGEFLACSGYPDCKFTQSVHAGSVGKSTEVKCPECSDGEIIERKSKRGKIFYGCGNYPDCSFAIWDKPVDKQCPVCDAKFLVEKSTKRDGDFLKCHDKDCGYQNNN
ncbi:MAG: type I DNA topoisomerase [Desulfobacterales bacterium]|nr:type I DNA topoisomerase [Desulfobacterales bacterium]